MSMARITQQPAVEGHAAFPDAQERQRVAGQLLAAVEQHVADAPAEDDAERPVEDDVVHLRGGDGRGGALRPPVAEPPGGREADEVHDPVPAHGERAEVQSHRVEMRISNQAFYSTIAPR
jgi:hypothetical protein